MTRPMPPAVLLAVAVCLAGPIGCHHDPDGDDREYRTHSGDPDRDTQRARRLADEAVALIDEGQLERAEGLLKEALAADVFYGPAHNNLGHVYLRTDRYYSAAWEFQYAIKLMPEQYEPRNNLGLVFEEVGRLPEAAEAYEEALAIAPDAVEVIGNLARAYVRLDRKDDRTRDLLRQLVLKDTRPPWRAWARERLSTMGRGASEPADDAAPDPTPETP